MLDRRASVDKVSPDHEDSGLFKTQLVRLNVQLTPQMGKNARGDYQIKGFVESDTEVDVLFAGRRRATADTAITQLRRMWGQAVNTNPNNPPKPSQVRLKIKVLGAWRPQFENDDQGWLTRHYQLVVAQWSMTDSKGVERTFGQEPVGAKIPSATTPQQRGRRAQQS